jgi:hypothetical protein
MVLRVGVLVRAGTRQLCLIRRLSPRGLMVRLFSDVELGEAVVIELSEARRPSGRIACVAVGDAIIRFDRPADIGGILAPRIPRPAGPRRVIREVDRLAMIRAGSDISFASTRHISQGGVRVVCERPLAKGTPVVLTLEGFRPLQGMVRWNRGGCCTISFDRMVPPGELERWLAS